MAEVSIEYISCDWRADQKKLKVLTSGVQEQAEAARSVAARAKAKDKRASKRLSYS